MQEEPHREAREDATPTTVGSAVAAISATINEPCRVAGEHDELDDGFESQVDVLYEELGPFKNAVTVSKAKAAIAMFVGKVTSREQLEVKLRQLREKDDPGWPPINANLAVFDLTDIRLSAVLA